MDDWLETERDGWQMGGVSWKARRVGGTVGGKWRESKEWISDGTGGEWGGEGGRERGSTFLGDSARGSGGEWMDRGWDGWMEGKGGVTGLPSSNRDRWRPSANRVSPSFHLRPHGKIPLPHICGQTRGPGMLVQHYSKMTNAGGGWWREGWRGKEAGQVLKDSLEKSLIHTKHVGLEDFGK